MTTPPNGDQLKITTANTLDQHHTCDNTPIELTATLTSGNTITSTLWRFDDGSYYTVSGNSFFHTFGYDINNNGYTSYTIIAISEDVNRCSYNTTHVILAHDDIMNNGDILRTPLYGAVCPYTNFIGLNFRDHPRSATLYPHTNWWWSNGTDYGTVHNADHTDDYYAYAVNNFYCQGQASLNVGFLQAPEAVISYDNAHFCAGVPIVLHGESGPNPSLFQYGWTITDGGGSTVFTGTTSTVTFTPTHADSYTVLLTVTGVSSGCVGQDTKTLVVNPTPVAPSSSARTTRTWDP